MPLFPKNSPQPKPEIRYVLKFMSHDRYILAEYFDGSFTETVLEVRRRDGVFSLEVTSHHYNSKSTNTDCLILRPFDRFDDFFSQLVAFCRDFDPDAEILRSDDRLMRFLSLHKFIHLLGDDQHGAEAKDGNIIVIEGKPHIIRGDGSVPTTWDEARMLAEQSRPSTGLWLRDLNETNWERYTFQSFPWWRHGPRRSKVYFFRDTQDQASVWTDFVYNSIVRDRETGMLYLRHEVADGQSDHYPRLIENDIPISAEEVQHLDAAGLLSPCRAY